MYHIVFCLFFALVLCVLFYLAFYLLSGFRKIPYKTNLIIFVFVFILMCQLMPEKYFLKFRSMNSAIMYASFSTPNYTYEGDDWGFAIFNADSSPILKSVSKQNDKWLLPYKVHRTFRNVHNHVGRFKVLTECDFKDMNCLIVIWPIGEEQSESYLMTDSYGDTFEHAIINNTSIYFIKNINLDKNYSINYNGKRVIIN